MSGAYLDNSATTRPDPRVVEVVLRSFRDAYGNPSSLHASGRFARRGVDDAREKIAAALDKFRADQTRAVPEKP